MLCLRMFIIREVKIMATLDGQNYPVPFFVMRAHEQANLKLATKEKQDTHFKRSADGRLFLKRRFLD